MMEAQKLARFGDVREISKEDWVREVNKAGDGVWVVIHVYKNRLVWKKIKVICLFHDGHNLC